MVTFVREDAGCDKRTGMLWCTLQVDARIDCISPAHQVAVWAKGGGITDGIGNDPTCTRQMLTSLHEAGYQTKVGTTRAEGTVGETSA